jgi:hypothetical protein
MKKSTQMKHFKELSEKVLKDLKKKREKSNKDFDAKV